MPNFGYETVGTVYTNCENEIHGSHFEMLEDGEVQSITVYLRVVSLAREVKCAIYAYVGDTDAGVLIAVTEERLIPVGEGWEPFNFGTPPPLTASTRYFLVVWSKNRLGGTYVYRESSYPIAAGIEAAHTYNSFPDPLTGETQRNYVYSIYCTYSTGAPSGWQSINREATTGWKEMERLIGTGWKEILTE